MRRRSLLVVLIFVLTSCGQPLVTTAPRGTRLPGQTPPATAATTTPAPTDGLGGSPEGATDTIVAAPAEESPAATLATAEPPTAEAPPTAEPPTAEPPTAAPAPTQTPAVTVVPQPPPPLTNEQRWRAQQLDRQVFETRRIYVARSRTPLYWYDPLTGQTLEIGALLGDVTVQAHFVLRDGNRPALEVPYRINGDFGLTSISDAVRQRMQTAGYTESVEAYVLESDAVQPK